MRSEWVPPLELATFRLARFRLRLKAKETLYLPAYKGSALRGGFGQVFRHLACLGAERGFGECLLGARCPYHYIFETRLRLAVWCWTKYRRLPSRSCWSRPWRRNESTNLARN